MTSLTTLEPSIHVDQEAGEYLAAAGVAAIYVLQSPGAVLRVGASANLAAVPLRGGRLVWVGWVHAPSTAVRIAQRFDTRITTDVAGLVKEIEIVARSAGVTITPHERAIEKAQKLAADVEILLAKLKSNGTLSAFNAAYRRHRLTVRNAPNYAIVLADLRRCVISALAQGRPLNLKVRFPWFA